MIIHLIATPETAARVQLATEGHDVQLFGANQLRTRRPNLALDPDLIIFDAPCTIPVRSINHAGLKYLQAHPHVGVVLIGALAAVSAELVITVAGKRVLEVTMAGPGTAGELWQAIQSAVSRTIAARLLLHVAPALDTLDARIATAIRRVIAGGVIVEDMPQLATLSEHKLRTLYRHMKSAGFMQPKDVVRAARYIRHLPTLYDRTKPLTNSDVYRDFGWSDYEQFQQHTRRLLGDSPRALRYSTDPTLVAPHLAHVLIPSLSV